MVTEDTPFWEAGNTLDTRLSRPGNTGIPASQR